MATAILLLSNATATGGAKAVTSPGDYCFAVDGTFSGATVSLEMQSPDGSSWVAIASSGLTAEGGVIISLPANVYRAAVASGPPSGIYATLSPVFR